MSGFSQTLHNFRNIWKNGDDDFLEDEDDYDADRARDDANESNRQQSQDAPANASSTQSRAVEAPRPSDRAAFSHGGGNGSGSSVDNVKRLRPVSPALRAREKNIYALRPRSQEEAVAAADALKTGDAVIINLEEVPRPEAIRIIDFMSGVCYGLEHQGHAMKLGELIFLYTPGDFEISSDESDYGENVDPFFMDEGDKLAALSRVAINNPRVISVVNMPADAATSTQSSSTQPSSTQSSPAMSQNVVSPSVVAQMAQIQAQAAQAVNAQSSAELTASQAQVVADPQLQAQRDAIRAAQNARSQSLPGEPLAPLSPFQRAIPAPPATSAETPSHLTAQGYISPSSPTPRATNENSPNERARRPWER